LKKHIYVISDLHLGGNPALPTESYETISFQMCPFQARRRLAKFIHHLRAAHPGEDVHLVINGDFIDFLAEEAQGSTSIPQFEAFTASSEDAVIKLDRVIKRTDEGAPQGERVFEALQVFLVEGHSLTIILGNHDLELSLPACRRRLISALTDDKPAKIELILDGEAFEHGDLIVEHGNRYDGWNAVAYGVLRAHRSRVSRHESPYNFLPPPGSRLVSEIMNPKLKRRYRFIDLLKPENEALIPVLTALEPDLVSELSKVFLASLYMEKRRIEPKSGKVPDNESYVAAGLPTDDDGAIPVPEDDLFGDTLNRQTYDKTMRLLDAELNKWRIERVPEMEERVAAGLRGYWDSARSLWQIRRETQEDDRYIRLREAFIIHREEIGATFDIGKEAPLYLEAARRLSAGRRVVVFGHTHLPKHIQFQGGGLYLNTGTWCPIVQFPEDFYDKNLPDAEVIPGLKRFVDDLCCNRVEGWCLLQTTFAHIVFSEDHLEPRLCEFHDDGSVSELKNAHRL
jgi:UDP-2,3-diacylglucosamine pyrophosphatase LpxH